uniref:Uncharacterized protein n=1 Tax=Heliothis virescens TaxID=7102 RepID=A0A2A4JRQ5_HELVI
MDKNGEAESHSWELLQRGAGRKGRGAEALQVLQEEGAGFFTPRSRRLTTPPTTSISTPGLIIAATHGFTPAPAHIDATEPGPDIEQGREENLDVTRRGPEAVRRGHSTTEKTSQPDLRPTTECVTFGPAHQSARRDPPSIALVV